MSRSHSQISSSVTRDDVSGSTLAKANNRVVNAMFITKNMPKLANSQTGNPGSHPVTSDSQVIRDRLPTSDNVIYTNMSVNASKRKVLQRLRRVYNSLCSKLTQCYPRCHTGP